MTIQLKSPETDHLSLIVGLAYHRPEDTSPSSSLCWFAQYTAFRGAQAYVHWDGGPAGVMLPPRRDGLPGVARIEFFRWATLGGDRIRLTLCDAEGHILWEEDHPRSDRPLVPAVWQQGAALLFWVSD